MKEVSNKVISSLCCPRITASREEVLNQKCLIPKKNGIYAWYIRNLPPVVPLERCIQHKDYYLVYIGISPRKEGGNGNLRTRISSHFGKTKSQDASWSTLRLSLGCLLSEQLNIQLQCVRGRKHFDEGESVLSNWMAKNAIVAWHVFGRPWEIETGIIEKLSLPLNLSKNKQHCFYSYLYNLRKTKRKACICG